MAPAAAPWAAAPQAAAAPAAVPQAAAAAQAEAEAEEAEAVQAQEAGRNSPHSALRMSATELVEEKQRAEAMKRSVREAMAQADARYESVVEKERECVRFRVRRNR